jgi:hypothetical protein
MDEAQWHTCKHCGIKNGEDISNWVFSYECRKCREKRENEQDFEESKKEGEITRDNSIMCCYCGYVDYDECYEYNNNDTWTCPECEKQHGLLVDFTTHYKTYKKEKNHEKKEIDK